MLRLIFAGLILAAQFSMAATHTSSGTEYGVDGSVAYAKTRHGPDGEVFLDPYFVPFLQSLADKTLLDVGCGAAPWSILAAQNGAKVQGVDIQTSMIKLGLEAVKNAKLEEQVFLQVGDAAALAYNESQFDAAISINVGCNLPSLDAHLAEIHRTLKLGGKLVVTAPASFEVLFTNGSRSLEQVQNHVEQVLAKLGENPSLEEVAKGLAELSDIYRGTFSRCQSRICWVNDTNTLAPGQAIWRKLPGMVVPNFYHPESEYLEAFAKAGLRIDKIHRPKFADRDALLEHNKKSAPEKLLGDAYTEHHAFVIFELSKNDSNQSEL